MRSQRSSGKPKRLPKFVIRRVNGDSMAPTLQPGQVLIAIRHRRYKPGHVIVIRHAGIDKVKRLHSYEAGTIEIFGDNLDGSTDSRDFGRLSETVIIGRVIWPRISR